MKCQDVDITNVKVLGGYRLELTFDDGKTGEVDLQHIISFNGIFKPLKNKMFFKTVKVNKDIGTICWDNGADISPGYLYENIQ